MLSPLLAAGGQRLRALLTLSYGTLVSQNGDTALHMACKLGWYNCVRAMVQACWCAPGHTLESMEVFNQPRFPGVDAIFTLQNVRRSLCAWRHRTVADAVRVCCCLWP